MKREWITELRINKKLSQEELARQCDVSQMTISNIENGTRRPSPKLAKKLGVILKFDWTKFYDESEKEET